MSKPEPILLITDAMGVYIPRNFATYFGEKRSEHVSNVSGGGLGGLKMGPGVGHFLATDTIGIT